MGSLTRTQEDPSTGVTALWFVADGWVPNNQRLPALLYRQAIPADPDRAAACEGLFERERLAAAVAQRHLSISSLSLHGS